MMNEYGPTETVVGCCVTRSVGRGGSASVNACRSEGRSGTRRLYVLDEGKRAVPRGVSGELYIGGERLGAVISGEPI